LFRDKKVVRFRAFTGEGSVGSMARVS
jgi:hypothetical protein